MDFRRWLSFNERVYIAGREFRDKDALEALNHLYRTHPAPENLVVTYTQVDKVGINPKTPYDTPLGIYFYPLYHVLDSGLRVEYASGSPFLQVCELTQPEKMLHMRNSGSDLPSIEDEGVDMLVALYGEPLISELLRHLRKQTRENISNYWTFYYLVGLLAQTKMGKEKPADLAPNPIFAKQSDIDRKSKTFAGITRWNTIFRKLGIIGFVDHGTGTIYYGENTQGVVFSKEAIKVIHTIDNPLRANKSANQNRIHGQYEKFDQLASRSEEKGLLFLQHNILTHRKFHGPSHIAVLQACVAPFKATKVNSVLAALLNNKYLDEGQLGMLLRIPKGMSFFLSGGAVDTMSLSLTQRFKMLNQINVDKIANSRRLDAFSDDVIDRRIALVSRMEFAVALVRQASLITPQIRDLVVKASHLSSKDRDGVRACEALAKALSSRGEKELADQVRSNASSASGVR